MTDVNKNNSEQSFDTLSKRLKYVIESIGIKQSHMASKLGMSPSNLHYILNQEDISSKNMDKNVERIAEVLEINPIWLKTGEGDLKKEGEEAISPCFVYYPDQLKMYLQTHDDSILKSSHHFPALHSYKNKTFGLFITDSTLSPKFEIGDRILIEEADEFNSGEIILVFFSWSRDLVLGMGLKTEKELSINGQKLELVDGNFIVGVYRECHKVSSAVVD